MIPLRRAEGDWIWLNIVCKHQVQQYTCVGFQVEDDVFRFGRTFLRGCENYDCPNGSRTAEDFVRFLYA